MKRLLNPATAAAAATLCLSMPAVAQDTHTNGVNISDANTSSADLFVSDTSVLSGFACIGFDCVDAEVFSISSPTDPILRIHDTVPWVEFRDSSVSSPGTRDWVLRVNDTGTSPIDRFSIEDLDAGTIPFTVEGAAPENALWINDTNGNIGFGTSQPISDLHVVSGNGPSLRLEQDTSGGNVAQQWLLSGNGGSFSILDQTTGTIPFGISVGAPQDSIFVMPSGNVGIGTSMPAGPLDISTGADSSAMFFSNNSGSWKFNHNVSTGRFNIAREGGNTPFKMGSSAAQNLMRLGITANDMVDIAGNVSITGTLVTGGGGTCDPGPCDAVFDPAVYTVPSIEDHATLMWQNKHLPAVGPTKPGAPINVAIKMTRMLNELEHAHIYIEQLHDRLAVAESLNSGLAARVEALEAAVLE